jgi:hypothetical protein
MNSSNDYFYNTLRKYNKGIFIYVDFIHDYYTESFMNLVEYWASIWRIEPIVSIDKENQRYIVKFDLNTSSSSDPCSRDFIFLGNTRCGLSYLLINGVDTKNTFIVKVDTQFIIVPITENVKKPKPICKKCGSHRLINIYTKCTEGFQLFDVSNNDREYDGTVPKSLAFLKVPNKQYLDLTICPDCSTIQEDLDYDTIMKECFNNG